MARKKPVEIVKEETPVIKVKQSKKETVQVVENSPEIKLTELELATELFSRLQNKYNEKASNELSTMMSSLELIIRTLNKK
jgi:hypothetical protein